MNTEKTMKKLQETTTDLMYNELHNRYKLITESYEMGLYGITINEIIYLGEQLKHLRDRSIELSWDNNSVQNFEGFLKKMYGEYGKVTEKV